MLAARAGLLHDPPGCQQHAAAAAVAQRGGLPQQEALAPGSHEDVQAPHRAGAGMHTLLAPPEMLPCLPSG